MASKQTPENLHKYFIIYRNWLFDHKQILPHDMRLYLEFRTMVHFESINIAIVN